MKEIERRTVSFIIVMNYFIFIDQNFCRSAGYNAMCVFLLVFFILLLFFPSLLFAFGGQDSFLFD